MPTTSGNAREVLAHDILWGVDGPDGIANYLGIPPHKCYYLIRCGKIPIKKLSHRIICASRAELSRAFGRDV